MTVDLLRCALPTEARPALAEAIRRPFLRTAALEALAAARANPSHATPTLATWFRRTRRLGSRDRPVVQEAVFGVIRHEHLLLRSGARDDGGLLDAWARLIDGDRFSELASSSPAEDLSTALSVGCPLASGWLRSLGAEGAASLGAALGGRAPVIVRANAARCSRGALAERLAADGIPTEPVPNTSHGLVLGKRIALGNVAAHREGWFEIQDAASQRLVDAIPMDVGQRVLDLCAGAGGKSLALAARGARVNAWDVRSDALRELRKRAKRAGVRVRTSEPAPAPIVLIDAPCSATGRLRRDPALRWGLEPGGALATQRALIDQGGALVEPGGLLVYATCSMQDDENDHAAPAAGGPWVQVDTQRLWPHRDHTDGFGWRIWRRGTNMMSV